MDSKIAFTVIITAAISFSFAALLFFSINRLLAKRRKSSPLIHLKNPNIEPNQNQNQNQNDLYNVPNRCHYCDSQLKPSSDEKEDLPPSVALDVVKSMEEIPPPPPPPPPVKYPPPPPPVMRGGGPPIPAGLLRPPAVAEGGKEKPRFKPLHWDKVTPANAGQSMVWDKIAQGSTRFDDDLLESLFGYTTTSCLRRPSSTTTKDSTPLSNPIPSQIRLLDPRKSQNTAIIIRTLAVSRQHIIDFLLQGHPLDHDTLEKLSRISLTTDEVSLILSFSGDHSHLADAESFLFDILKSVPSAFPRFSALHFRFSVYQPEILLLKDYLKTLDLACNELRTRPLFLKLLEAILKAGNRMNAGTARGNAQAFDLIALRKLSDVKSTDGKTNLLHFVVEEVVRSEGKRCAAVNWGQEAHRHAREEREKEFIKLGLSIVNGLSNDLANVKSAAAIDHDAVTRGAATLGSQLAEIEKLVGGWKGEGGGFVIEMTEFVEGATGEIENLKEEQGIVMEKVRRTTEYYQPGASKDKAMQPLQLFVIVRDFLAMVDQVCVDIAKDLRKNKTTVQPVMEGGVNRLTAAKMAEFASMREEMKTTRFPNLPVRFMSDNWVPSSDSEEEEF